MLRRPMSYAGDLTQAEFEQLLDAKGGPAAVVLEDDPHFNAGTGAALTSDGEVELDASCMDGTTLRAGAVACVKTVKNPILAARRVCDDTPHVLLCGPGAEAFAREW